jgi:hypothetical protein
MLHVSPDRGRGSFPIIPLGGLRLFVTVLARLDRGYAIQTLRPTFA